jgi:hypothetical protein
MRKRPRPTGLLLPSPLGMRDPFGFIQSKGRTIFSPLPGVISYGGNREV